MKALNASSVKEIANRVSSASDAKETKQAVDKLKAAVTKYYSSAHLVTKVTFKQDAKKISWEATWALPSVGAMVEIKSLIDFFKELEDYIDDDGELTDGATPIKLDKKRWLAVQTNFWSMDVVLETYGD